MKYREKDNIKNLILDYDGVISYKNKKYDRNAKNLIYKVYEVKNDLLLHINSQRGITLFSQKFPREVLKKMSKSSKFYFSGDGGAFIYDFSSKKCIHFSKGLEKKVIEFLANNKFIKDILDLTGQADHSLWKRHENSIKRDLYILVKREQRLFWDIGYPDSCEIYKCSIDLPSSRRLIQKLKETILEKFSTVKVDITGRYLEITNKAYDKGSIIKEMWKRGLYLKGSLISIGDNPHRADKVMLHALPYRLTKDIYFKGLSNNNTGKDIIGERVLYKNFMNIIKNLFFKES